MSFYAHREIKEIAPNSEGDKVGILFADDDKSMPQAITVPKWEADACVSEEKKDLGWLRNEKANVVVSKLLDVMLSMDITVEDTRYICQKLEDSIVQSHSKSVDKLFGKQKSQLRMSDLDSVLKK